MSANNRPVPVSLATPDLPRFENEAVRIRTALAERMASVPIWTPDPDWGRTPRWSETTQSVFKKESERIAYSSEQK